MLKIHNSLTRKKEVFQPITKNKLAMYVCGMTVYDFCHIGHARVIVVFDMIRRYFEASNYEVEFVRNITDIDDKIIQRALENNEDISSLTNRFIKAMHEDEKQLKALPPTKEPKATQTINEMIEMIKELIENNYAYQSDSGDILYSVASFLNYGKLANQKLDELQAGQRVEVDKSKRNPLDFVLWKSAKQGEPFWESPWGNGRPGWHIECSAMAKKELGNHFDIHGGGLDLKFPHHECEIAQSEPTCDGKHVNYWIHNGFVQIDSEKMSKSLGNFFTIKDVLENFKGEVIRFFILGTHYRSPLNYSDAGLQEAGNGLERLYTSLNIDENSANQSLENISLDDLKAKYVTFFEAMNDDFNTSKAISELFAISKNINKTADKQIKIQLACELKSLAKILGILQDNPKEFLQSSNKNLEINPQEIDNLITKRNQARVDKDFKLSDEIRDLLAEKGIIIEDKMENKIMKTTWRVK